MPDTTAEAAAPPTVLRISARGLYRAMSTRRRRPPGHRVRTAESGYHWLELGARSGPYVPRRRCDNDLRAAYAADHCRQLTADLTLPDGRRCEAGDWVLTEAGEAVLAANVPDDDA